MHTVEKTVNKEILKEEYVKKYIKVATKKELEQLALLLNEGNYEEVNRIIDEFINAKDETNKSKRLNDDRKYYSIDSFDPKSFELYCILMLIEELQKEKNEESREMIKKEIQRAINKFQSIDDHPLSKKI